MEELEASKTSQKSIRPRRREANPDPTGRRRTNAQRVVGLRENGVKQAKPLQEGVRNTGEDSCIPPALPVNPHMLRNFSRTCNGTDGLER